MSERSRKVLTCVLEQIIEARGAPQSLICDNGPELTSRHFLSWCDERKIALIPYSQRTRKLF